MPAMAKAAWRLSVNPFDPVRTAAAGDPLPPVPAFWAVPAEELAGKLGSGPGGLTAADAAARLATHGPNALRERAVASAVRLLLRQFASPLLAILIVAAGRDKITSTPAIETFSARLRAGSHLIIAGAQHEIMMEQDGYRQQFWAAFDAFVPGTPLYK